MKVTYKGHEIEVTRDRSMAGYSMLFYSVFRKSDGYECTSGFSDSTETVREFAGILRGRIDAELAEVDPWGEKASEDIFDEEV